MDEILLKFYLGIILILIGFLKLVFDNVILINLVVLRKLGRLISVGVILFYKV